MNRGIQRFIPIVFLIVIVGLIIAAAVSVVQIFTNNDTNETSQVENASNEALLSTTAERSVRMTVRGPIVGDDMFRSYRISVTPSKREFTRYKGYLEQPLVNKNYENNTKAYSQFVNALSRAQMAAGTPLTGEADDTLGICFNGVLYEFEIINGASVVERLWTTSCADASGSLKANVGQVQGLFLAQIPDVDEYIGKD